MNVEKGEWEWQVVKHRWIVRDGVLIGDSLQEKVKGKDQNGISGECVFNACVCASKCVRVCVCVWKRVRNIAFKTIGSPYYHLSFLEFFLNVLQHVSQ